MPDRNSLLTAGLTDRQITHWTAKGLLKAENPRCGIGVPMRWSFVELRVAEVMARLVKAGLTVEAAHKVARAGGTAELAPGIKVEVS